MSNKESSWTPPEGNFTAIDHYVDRCRRAVNVLDFKTTTHQNNLSPSEKQALLHFTKRDDIIIKPAVKGGAVVVWSRPLYDAEAHRQLSDGRFYERLDQDPVKVIPASDQISRQTDDTSQRTSGISEESHFTDPKDITFLSSTKDPQGEQPWKTNCFSV